MKKAKIVLTVLALIAVVGGAVAFKASKYNISPYATTRYALTTVTINGVVFPNITGYCPTVLVTNAATAPLVQVFSATATATTTSGTSTFTYPVCPTATFLTRTVVDEG